MRYARGPGPDPQLIEAERGHTGTCPGCGSALVAKCGTIVSPHWAHHARPDCDDWSEPESEWHLAWKRHAPPERTEVVMGANREHRADVVLPNGWVLELQHSALSAEAIREREEFYTREAGGMCWLWDARRFWGAVQLRHWEDNRALHLARHRTLRQPRRVMFWDIPVHERLELHVEQWRFDYDIGERMAAAHLRWAATRSALAAGVIAQVRYIDDIRYPRRRHFRIEQLIPRDQFAAAIRGPQ